MTTLPSSKLESISTTSSHADKATGAKLTYKQRFRLFFRPKFNVPAGIYMLVLHLRR